MVCKLVPIFSFIIAMVFVFDFDVFTADFWGNVANNLDGASYTNVNGTVVGAPGPIPRQIVNCLMVMMWVFVGMEGASVLGHRAERKSDVSRASILGCTILVAIYVAASILPYGYLTREELMRSSGRPPCPTSSSASWAPGAVRSSRAGLIVSVLGAWLSFTMLASEALCGMAQMKLLPRAFSHLNAYSAPTACLFTTGAMVQLLTIVMMFSSEAYQLRLTRSARRRSPSAGRSPPHIWSSSELSSESGDGRTIPKPSETPSIQTPNASVEPIWRSLRSRSCSS
ncbi:MAG: amino acid permease [Collinsella sp.]